MTTLAATWRMVTGLVLRPSQTGWIGHAYLILLSQVLAAGLGVVYWVIAARFYPAHEVGKASAELSLVFLLSTVAELGLRSALVRYLPQRPGNGRDLILRFAALNAIAALLLSAATLAWDGRWIESSWTQTAWLAVAVLVWTQYFVQSGALIGLRLTNRFLLQSVLFNAGKLVLLVGLAWWAVPDALAISWFVCAPVLTLAFMGLCLREAHAPPDGGHAMPVPWRDMGRLISLDYVGSLLAETTLRLVPLAILRLVGAAEAAYFYQAFLVSSMLRLVTSSLVSSYTVEAARDPARQREHGRRLILLGLGLSACGSLFLFVFGWWVMRVFGEDYAREGTLTLQLLGASAIPYVVNAWLIAHARLAGRGLTILANETAQFAFTFGPLMLLVPRMGLDGVAVACLIGQIVPMTLAAGALREVFRRPAGGAAAGEHAALTRDR